MSSPITSLVLDWGRSKATLGKNLTDNSGQFTIEQTEQLRRELRVEYLNRNQAIVGDWRRGYELSIGNERVGVTNGYGRFRVYYRCNQDIPFDGRPVSIKEWADDYGLP